MQNGNREVVIVEAVRTPVGRGHEEKGYYKDTHPSNLLSKTYSELVERAGVDGERGRGRDHRLRAAVRRAGLQHRPQRVARGGAADRDARHHDRPPVRLGPAGRELRRRPGGRRGAGLRHRLGRRAHGPHLVRRRLPGAVRARRCVLARAARALQPDPPGPVGRDDRRPVGDPALGARRARACGPTRWPTRPPRRAGSSARSCPYQVNGDTYVADQGIRPGTDIEKLAALKPAFKEDGKITAGNSSQISDGAAAVLLMERGKAESLGLKPRARVVDQVTVGVDPVIMLTGPIPATRKLLERNGMTMDDIDLVEINEAFAPVVAAWQRELDADMDRVNVNGGAMAHRPPARIHRRAPAHHPAARARALGQAGRSGHDVLRRRAGNRHADRARLRFDPKGSGKRNWRTVVARTGRT